MIKMLENIQKMLADIHTDMIEGFNTILENQKQMHRELMEAIALLRKDVQKGFDEVKDRLGKIIEKTGVAQRYVDELARTSDNTELLFNQIGTLRTEYSDKQLQGTFNADDVQRTLEKIEGHALGTSQKPGYTGKHIFDDDKVNGGELQGISRADRGHALLPWAVNQLRGPTQEEIKFPSFPLQNPIELARAAKAFGEAAIAFPDATVMGTPNSAMRKRLANLEKALEEMDQTYKKLFANWVITEASKGYLQQLWENVDLRPGLEKESNGLSMGQNPVFAFEPAAVIHAGIPQGKGFVLLKDASSFKLMAEKVMVFKQISNNSISDRGVYEENRKRYFGDFYQEKEPIDFQDPRGQYALLAFARNYGLIELTEIDSGLIGEFSSESAPPRNSPRIRVIIPHADNMIEKYKTYQINFIAGSLNGSTIGGGKEGWRVSTLCDDTQEQTSRATIHYLTPGLHGTKVGETTINNSRDFLILLSKELEIHHNRLREGLVERQKEYMASGDNKRYNDVETLTGAFRLLAATANWYQTGDLVDSTAILHSPIPYPHNKDSFEKFYGGLLIKPDDPKAVPSAGTTVAHYMGHMTVKSIMAPAQQEIEQYIPYTMSKDGLPQVTEALTVVRGAIRYLELHDKFAAKDKGASVPQPMEPEKQTGTGRGR